VLRREGWALNRKKVLRIWREEGLKVQARHHKRRRPPHGELVRRAERPNHVWAIDFQFDATSDGRMLKLANIVDEFTREAIGIRTDRTCTSDHLVGGDHARKALRQALRSPVPRKPRKQPVLYGSEVLEPLKRVWATLDAPCGKRLHAVMAETVEALERHGELALTPSERSQLLRMSAATMDRRLAPERRRLRVKGRSGTKPGSLLKSKIAIRTFAEWDDARPGFCEVDLVAIDGGTASGEFCQTLDLTCVATGWTEPRAVPTKAQRHVFEALKDIERSLPFPLLGLDSDNGSEFINGNLYDYCSERKITFTRSRPYRKNDNCFVEQKNWTVVRQQVGYARYDPPGELKVLNELYSHLRLYVNFFLPQARLTEKIREGATVRRRHDTPGPPTGGPSSRSRSPTGPSRPFAASTSS